MEFESLEIDGVLYNLVEIKKGGKNYGLLVIINPKDIGNNLLDFISSRNIRALTVSIGTTEAKNVDFLQNKAFCQIEYLNLVGNLIDGIGGITLLQNLTCFIYNGVFSMPFDFSELKKLRILEVLYNPNKTNGIPTCTELEQLTIYHYKAKEKTLDEFSSLVNLESLSFYQSDIYSLNGMQNMNSLKYLRLNYLKNLQEIVALHNKKSLNFVSIQNAKKINDWEVIGSLENIQELFVHNCGFIKNLDFLKELQYLEKIKISSTKIEESFDWIWDFEPFRNTTIYMPNGVYRNH